MPTTEQTFAIQFCRCGDRSETGILLVRVVQFSFALFGCNDQTIGLRAKLVKSRTHNPRNKVTRPRVALTNEQCYSQNSNRRRFKDNKPVRRAVKLSRVKLSLVVSKCTYRRSFLSRTRGSLRFRYVANGNLHRNNLSLRGPQHQRKHPIKDNHPPPVRALRVYTPFVRGKTTIIDRV
eukprot:3111119-Pyramimonas_sp.AAC.1